MAVLVSTVFRWCDSGWVRLWFGSEYVRWTDIYKGRVKSRYDIDR